MKQLAPVILFTYNRPQHVAKTVAALRENVMSDQTDLIIFSDAAKNEKAVPLVEETRSFLDTINGFKSVTLIKREKNWGLANNIMDGVSSVVNEYGRVIVLEDDLVSSKYFLQYMNDALDKYENNEKVISVTAYLPKLDCQVPPFFFKKGTNCWGWATWKRGWDLFNSDGVYLFKEIVKRHEEKRFNANFSYDFVQMLKDQALGKNTSWAIRWHASAYLRDMYSLYPGISMVTQIGEDGSGTNGGNAVTKYETTVSDHPLDLSETPEVIEESKAVNNAYIRFRLKGMPLKSRIFRVLCLLFNSRLDNKFFNSFRKH